MKLRSKLILAFLLLSVLPLSGMTIYGYRSSLSAFREAVELEADEMTAEMSGRMETVTADLGARMKRLNSLPYEALLAQNADAVDDDPMTDRFLRTLQDQVGDAAPWIESLKYTPLPPRPPRPPAPGAAPPSPQPGSTARVIGSNEIVTIETEGDAAGEDAEPWVIHLNSMLFDEAGERGTPAGRGHLTETRHRTRVIKSGKNWLVMPANLEEVAETVVPSILESIRVFVDDEDVEKVIEQVTVAMGGENPTEEERALLEERAATLKVRGAELREEAQASIEEARRHVAEELGKITKNWNDDPEEFQRRLSQEGLGSAVKWVAGTAARHAPQFKLGRKFECDIEQDGETVGRVEAQLNAREVLNSVLSATRSDQGEIPFAIGADGSVMTPNPDDQETLEGLGLRALAQSGGAMRPTQLGDNWVVQTRQVPEMDVVFGIARPVGESLGAIRRTAGRNMGLGLGIVLVAMLGIIPLSTRMTRNLTRLTHGAEQLAQGNLDVRVPVRSSDEFGLLARTFNRMGADLQQNQRQLVHQERLKKELEMCRQIQDEMLPRGRSSFPFAEVRAVSIPAREVGGDFFNYFVLPDGDVALLMGDVSGKGVPAALMMANLQAMLKARLPLEPDLATLAAALDSEIESGTPMEAYVTLFMGVIDARRQVLRYVNAGHNTQYLVNREDGIRRLACSGRPLGLLSGGRFVQHECPLKSDDLLFLFTDGLTEAQDDSGAEFGEKRLEELLVREQGGEPESILDRVESAVHNHRGQAEPADDATMLVLRYAPAKAEVATS